MISGPSTPSRSRPAGSSGGAPTYESPLNSISNRINKTHISNHPKAASYPGKAKSNATAAAAAAAAAADRLPAAPHHPVFDVQKDWEPESSKANTGKKSQFSSSRGDRYIPNRDLSRSMTSAESLLENTGGEALQSSCSSSTGPQQNAASIAKANQLPTDVAGSESASLEAASGLTGNGQRILSFSAVAPPSLSAPDTHARYAATKPKALPTSLTAGGKRKIAHTPIKTLDAAGADDDFYGNTLHWSARNMLAITLSSVVYVWNADTGDATSLFSLDEQNERVGGGADARVRSLRWDAEGNHLAVGTDSGHVQIWDVNGQQRLRTLKPHAEGGADNTDMLASAWACDGTLSTGYSSGLLRDHDVRMRESLIRDLDNAHSGAVCGLAWRGDGALLASGGNDNVVQVWDRRMDAPKMRKTNHNAAVKALAWCPWNDSLLATGGGLADRAIHMWNTSSGSRLHSIQTQHQLVGLHWSLAYREICSVGGDVNTVTGYERRGAISVWAHPSLANITTIESPHESKAVRHSTLSPDGQTLATIGDDDNLKLWTMFETSEEVAKDALKRNGQSALGGAAHERTAPFATQARSRGLR
ncbi:WD40 repeat-like protein [Ceraceosorus guamensis]|uniref:WD40 repeat-like protein n=1 Tax=Ceraceosorus guamensis TaxID=1522189 RepID=A0A316WA70_9BASI|nr:WD40 repeat-like protein [Ceraceosorus guamensis]PWN45631.1 WD40 repeat-like protein [Ceraceosorus guamensis]